MELMGMLVTADIWLNTMPDVDNLIKISESSINNSNMNIVEKFRHSFNPQGESLVYVLAESHYSVHSYPEQKYISVDCYTCGLEGNPKACINSLLSSLDVNHVKINVIKRGVY